MVYLTCGIVGLRAGSDVEKMEHTNGHTCDNLLLRLIVGQKSRIKLRWKSKTVVYLDNLYYGFDSINLKAHNVEQTSKYCV